MGASEDEFDAVVVGASIAGSTVAALLGEAGARVALVEQRPDPQAWKKVCTHLIQPSAVPTLERLGLIDELESAGAVRTRPLAHTPWGWIRPAPGSRVPPGLQIRREVFDPLLRARAISMSSVVPMLGTRVVEVLREGGRVRGVVTTGADGERRAVRGQVTVAADGRGSAVARLLRWPGRVRAHRRSSFWAYYRGLPLPGEDGQACCRLWFLNPDFAAAFPTDSGLTLVACMIPRDRAAEFKQDLEGNFEAMIGSLPAGPPLAGGVRTSPILGKLEMPNVARRAAGPGIAFVGDAALASDPLNAVGCGWALQSGEWLADALADAGTDDTACDAALGRYRRRHRLALGPHHLMNCAYATGRRFNLVERLILSGAVHDERLAERFEAFGGRLIQPTQFISPRALALAVAVAAKRRSRPDGVLNRA